MASPDETTPNDESLSTQDVATHEVNTDKPDRKRLLPASAGWASGFLYGLLCLVGVILLAWGGEKLGAECIVFVFPTYLSLAMLFLVLAMFGLFKLVYNFNAAMNPVESIADDAKRNAILYGRFISLLGVGIIFLSLINAITLGGLIYNEVLTVPFSKAAGKGGILSIIASGHILSISMLMAILGSLFFTANTLISSRNDGKSDFSRAKFWSGLWFRMGESVLFVLVFFVLICSSDDKFQKYIGWMPALALFLGMFVKSGERVVFGIAERLFEMVKVLLPAAAPSPRAMAPGAPRNLSGVLANNGAIELRWDEPLVGGPVTSYKIYCHEEKQDPKLVGETPPGNRRCIGQITGKDTACFYVTALNHEAESKPSNAIASSSGDNV